MSSDPKKKPETDKELNRRAALARLGIGVALAYSAPTVLHINRSANAALSTTPCSRGRRKPRWCRRKDRPGRDRDDDRRDRSRNDDRRGRGNDGRASRGNSRGRR